MSAHPDWLPTSAKVVRKLPAWLQYSIGLFTCGACISTGFGIQHARFTAPAKIAADSFLRLLSRYNSALMCMQY